jgi:hypothetical protein
MPRMSRENQRGFAGAHSKQGVPKKSSQPKADKRQTRFVHEQSAAEVSHQLGKTSDEYGPDPHDPMTEMPPGDQIALTDPDVQQTGPSGTTGSCEGDDQSNCGAAVDRGFGDARTRRDR